MSNEARSIRDGRTLILSDIERERSRDCLAALLDKLAPASLPACLFVGFIFTGNGRRFLDLGARFDRSPSRSSSQRIAPRSLLPYHQAILLTDLTQCKHANYMKRMRMIVRRLDSQFLRRPLFTPHSFYFSLSLYRLNLD